MIPTPSQTVGPFFSFGLDWMTAPSGSVPIVGCVTDGQHQPVSDAVVELWQPGHFARAFTGSDGSWSATLGDSAPAWVSVFARGLLQRLVTRMYPPGSGTDAVLESVDATRRSSLLATPTAEGMRFDIRLQGQGETVFFAW